MHNKNINLMWTATIAVVLVSFGFLGGCTCCATAEKGPVRAAVYVDKGARNTGVYRWLELTALAKGMVSTPVDAEMIRAGALDSQDLLIVPGGRSPLIAKTLGEEGREKVREFVRNGGGYVGTCAGSCLVMESSKSHPNMLNLIPYRSMGTRGHADMMIDFNERAKELAGIPVGSQRIIYAEGPILVPSTPVEGASFEVVATYGSYIDTDSRKRRETMAGKAAAVAGTYGKGRVFVFTVHPEYDYADHPCLEGAFRYVTGRDITWKIPQRRPGQLSVGFVTVNTWGVETANFLQSLIRSHEFDLRAVNDAAVNGRELNHLDALLAPPGNDFRKGPSMLVNCRDSLQTFMKRGGKIVTWGNAAAAYSELGRDVVSLPEGEDALKYLRDLGKAPSRAEGKLVVPTASGRPIRAAVYTDNGGANYNVLETLALSPGFEVKVLSAADIAGGALRDFDLLLQPGGGCHTQYVTLGTNGVNEIARFVRDGGKYYGICAGAFLATQTCEAKKPRIGIVPYRDQCIGTYRGWGDVPMKMTEEGLKVFGNSVTNRDVIYWGGPVLEPGTPIPDSDVKVLATYDCDVFCTCTNKDIPSWQGYAAFVGGRVGKGKAFISCPHPEKGELTYDMVLSGLEYLTGVRPQQIRRDRLLGSKSVMFRTAKERDVAAYFVNTLIRDRRFDVTSDSELGDLSHFDTIILMAPKKGDAKDARLKDFVKNGGRIVALANTPAKREAVKDVEWMAVANDFADIIPALEK